MFSYDILNLRGCFHHHHLLPSLGDIVQLLNNSLVTAKKFDNIATASFMTIILDDNAT